MHIAFRFECGGRHGYGHAHRCATLWNALRAERSARCTVVLQGHMPTGLFTDSACQVHQMPATTTSNSAQDAAFFRSAIGEGTLDWLVVDHYAVDASWHRRVRSLTRYILVLDDLADRPLDADLLVDPTWDQSSARYVPHVPATCRMLCGSAYALLRPEFAAQRQNPNKSLSKQGTLSLHVFLGGGASMEDVEQITHLLVQAVPQHSLHIVPAGARPGRSIQLPAQAHWVDPTQSFAATLASCDVAIGAPGTATWERACIGLPGLYFAFNANQVQILAQLAAKGFCYFLGSFPPTDAAAVAQQISDALTDRTGLEAMRRLGMAAVDGLGARRVVDTMVGLC